MKHTKKVAMDKTEYTNTLTQVGSCIDWEQFEDRYGMELRSMEPNDTVCVFKAGMRPVWEDASNRGPGAGKWIIPTNGRKSSVIVLQKMIEAMVDGTLDMNGIMITKKFGIDMAMVWMPGDEGKQTRGESKSALNGILEPLHAQGEITMSAVKYKMHESSKVRSKIDMEKEVDSEYERSPEGNKTVVNPYDVLTQVTV